MPSYNKGKRMFKPDVAGHECPLPTFTPHLYTRMEGSIIVQTPSIQKRDYNPYPQARL